MCVQAVNAAAGEASVHYMISSTQGVVVPAEGVEGAHFHPPPTHLLTCVPKEATDVSTNVGNPKQVELHHTCQRECQACS